MFEGPETKSRDIDTDMGKVTMTMYIFSNPADDNSAQMVETNPVDLKKLGEEKGREASMVGMINNLNAVVDDKKTVTVGTTTMLDFSSHFTDADTVYFLRGRVAVTNGTLYQVVAQGSGEKPDAAAELFVTSFKTK